MGDNNQNNERGGSSVELANCPEDVLRMIAWYHDEALGEDERAHIEAHAAECAACRNELDWMSGHASDELDAPALDAPPADAVYAKVSERIANERAGVASEPTAAAERPQRRQPRIEWRQLALAASVVVAVLAAFALGRGFPLTADPVYEVATDDGVATELPVLDVIFQPTATAEKINDALRAIGGTIVQGPTRLGVYRVELPVGADAVAAARMLRANGEGVASLAEVGGA